jgi:hypothetical protein
MSGELDFFGVEHGDPENPAGSKLNLEVPGYAGGGGRQSRCPLTNLGDAQAAGYPPPPPPTLP